MTVETLKASGASDGQIQGGIKAMTVTTEAAARRLALAWSQGHRALVIARTAANKVHEDTLHLDGGSLREAIDDFEDVVGARVLTAYRRQCCSAGAVIWYLAGLAGPCRNRKNAETDNQRKDKHEFLP